MAFYYFFGHKRVFWDSKKQFPHPARFVFHSKHTGVFPTGGFALNYSVPSNTGRTLHFNKISIILQEKDQAEIVPRLQGNSKQNPHTRSKKIPLIIELDPRGRGGLHRKRSKKLLPGRARTKIQHIFTLKMFFPP